MTDDPTFRRHCDCPGWNPRCAEFDCPRLRVDRWPARLGDLFSGRRRKWKDLVRQLEDMDNEPTERVTT
jgi:hypothetical protein